jgi:DNA-binding GntR family transcriptional regulator
MKSDAVFKAAFNDALGIVAAAGAGAPVPAENELSQRLGVSRTTVRKVLLTMTERGYLVGEGRNRVVSQNVPPDAAFPVEETMAASAQVERQFMEWMLRGDTKPGTLINELELARIFGVGTTGIREFLNRFSRFGLIEKRPNAGWLFNGFTTAFATELFEIRELFEQRSAMALLSLPATAPIWTRLRAMEREHLDLLRDIDQRFHDFSDLDNRFHRLINSAAPNRFINDFYDIITLIFHYHYQWNKRDERHRNEIAIGEHLDYIAAFLSRDPVAIQQACARHLASAQRTMMDSLTAADD